MLMKPNGGKIKPVFQPSLLDVKGLKFIYGKDTPEPPSLLQKSKQKFKGIFKKKNGGCQDSTGASTT